MATTKADLDRWFKEGRRKKATHMIVVCDSWDYEDFPVYVKKSQIAQDVYEQYQGKNMCRVMEVYDLKKNKKMQLDQFRTMET